jgi:hypothetical protein
MILPKSIDSEDILNLRHVRVVVPGIRKFKDSTCPIIRIYWSNGDTSYWRYTNILDRDHDLELINRKL